MYCNKCGSEIIDGRCNQCGYIQKINFVEYNSEPANTYPEEPANANTIKILGILSFFVPFLFIAVLVMAKEYNRNNNYGGSRDIKIGKICAKVVCWMFGLYFALVIAATAIYTVSTGFAVAENKEILDNLDDYSNSMIVEGPEYNDIFEDNKETEDYEQNNTTESSGNHISEEKALSIVLDWYELTKEDIKEYSVELPELYEGEYYEVEFKDDEYFYSLLVNSVTGDICSWSSSQYNFD